VGREVHHDGRHEAGGHVNRILNPEDRHVQNHIPHGAATDAGDDREPHEPHDVHALARRDERSGHGEDDRREDVEHMDQTGQVRGIGECGLHSIGSGGVARSPDRITKPFPAHQHVVVGLWRRPETG
jgi:hypothetical protein